MLNWELGASTITSCRSSAKLKKHIWCTYNIVAEFDASGCSHVGRPAMSSQHEGENRELQEDKKHGLPSDCVPGGEKYNVLKRPRIQVG